MITEKFKQTIFDKLSEDLSNTELFLYKESIWFINRENKYWYLEFKSSGQLYWRWGFFNIFFELFSLERPEYEPLIKEWVEGALKGGVTTTMNSGNNKNDVIKEVLKGGVTKTISNHLRGTKCMEEILNNGTTI